MRKEGTRMPAKKETAKKEPEKKAVKKAVAKTVAKAVDTGAKAAAKTAAPTKKAAKKPEVIIQSPMGGIITPEEILKRVGKVDKVYVRVDQNKAHWVRGDEVGSIDLWD